MRAIHCRVAMLIAVMLIAQSSGSIWAEERSDESALREIKEVLWPRAYAQQDVELLDSLLADEFQMVDADGNWSTKAEELDWVRSNPPSYDSLVFQILRLGIFENGSAIVAGKGIVSGTDEQGPYTLEYQSTNVLIKRRGKWQAVASHVSGIKREDARAEGSWTTDQRQVLASMQRLSAATAPDGTGADAYGAVLVDDFSRWTTGSSVINEKQPWVEGVREWFDEGWRVTDRDQEVLEVSVKGDFASTRRIVEETYLGPNGETSVSKAALAEAWVRVDGVWLLSRVNVDVMDSP